MDIIRERLAVSTPAEHERRLHARLDANCPVVLEIYLSETPQYASVIGRLINISLGGCLILSEHLPWRNVEPSNIDEIVYSTIETTCKVYLPWSNLLRIATIRRVGVFTAAVEFDRPISEKLVEKIAGMEQRGARTFKPRNPWKYNRILPRK
ncbi:PilZ domain-containing protein [Hoeflea halophila]|uniref:PilZ domain-containing protein n=1 Tax=Hoeflea halophila TaxID=714899 RepID=A0A286IBA5_9HYPH|nr:PilZ domain-containing protein [Hoeflea halophila]SOE17351.1 PilZ domain-containing protein [Hoeflea halophila]